LLKNELPNQSTPVIAINPGSDQPNKRMHPDSLAILADHLIKQYRAKIIILGGPGEIAIGNYIQVAMTHKAINLAGKLSLNDLCFIISKLDLLITNDSAPMHIAAALTIKQVAIFGPGYPTLFKPYTSAENYRLIFKELDCRPCNTKNCDHLSCISTITVSEVLAAANSFLDNSFQKRTVTDTILQKESLSKVNQKNNHSTEKPRRVTMHEETHIKKTVNSPCCICNSSDSSLLFETKYPYHRYPGNFILRKCDSCGLIFNSPRLIDEELFKLYGKHYYFHKRSDAVEFQRIAHVYLRTLALLDIDSDTKKVIEIGSAKGYLLALLKHLGWEVRGCELSPIAAEYAINTFGVDTYIGSVEQYINDSKKQFFPVTLAIDVIEHVPNPVGFFQALTSIIPREGFLVLDTPNADSYNISTLGYRWSGFNPFHIYLFNRHNLEKLLGDRGFSIQHIFTYNNHPQSRVSSSRKVKEFIKLLLFRIGILESSSKAFNAFLSKKNRPVINSDILIRNAENIIREEKTYLDSDDSRNVLAKDMKGDNIVIIAKK
jgi:2-polyprenyl-3-methyl-5-hydroxy-6-metoxy-1,4-benzoquinol methylase